MKTFRITSEKGRKGSALVAALGLMVVAGVAAGSIMTAALTYAGHTNRSDFQDKAAFLADSGLRAAVVKLNDSDEGNISFADSRDYFSMADGFAAPDWGFQTTLGLEAGRYFVVSVGRYNGHTVEVRSGVVLGAGQRSIHALYAHALYAGNDTDDTNYVLEVSGWGAGADFVQGDTYSGGNITLAGDSNLRLPEDLDDLDGDGICGIGETWMNAFAVLSYTNALSQADYDAYVAAQAPYMSQVYGNGHYDLGEAYVDTIGNGEYDVGEPFDDENGNGVRDLGDDFIDRNGNDVYDAGVDTVVDAGNGEWDDGEEWTEDTLAAHHSKRINGRYDPAGGFWYKSSGVWSWQTKYKKSGKWYYCSSWAAEAFEDLGDGVYDAGEDYTDMNGMYDVGEQYLDDRNDVYDYGTQAKGDITGLPAPGPGQRASTGGDMSIDPPDLSHMYYDQSKSGPEPSGALERWGNDVLVQASDYASGSGVAIVDSSKPEHIFVRNPSKSSTITVGGKSIKPRSYDNVYDDYGVRVDDYFFEDPCDSTYNSSVSGDSIDGSVYTAPMYITVKSNANSMVYYVDGNVYIHHPQVYSMRFRYPGTRITVVAKGNITISDEFYYNAEYADGLTHDDLDSTIVNNPSDAFCLIALRNEDCADSGNIKIGDAQFGTGGSIHALLYAENNFVDNNLNTEGQPYISVFGNMSAGNQLQLNRETGGGLVRTRLDVTLDERIRNGEIIVPGLPHPVGTQRSLIVDTAWHRAIGEWSCWSFLK